MPENFENVLKTAKSRNQLVKTYSVAPTVINRWIRESGLGIDVRDLSNTKKPKSEKKYPSPGKERIEEVLKEQGNLRAVCSFFNISRPVLNRWLREEGLKVEPYFGRIKKFNEKEFIEYCLTHNRNQVLTKYSTNINTLKKMCERVGIEMPKPAFWKSEEYREKAKQLFNEIVRLNEEEKKTLLEISKEVEIPISFIKEEVKNNNYTVKIFSYNKSKGENEIKEFIKKDFNTDCFSIKPEFNNKRFEIDCFVENENIGIEYCGEYWHSVERVENRFYHQHKTLWAKEQGINLLTFFEHEWIEKNEIVKSIISNKLGKIKNKIFARKTTVKEIDSEIAKEFHINNHIQGWVGSTVNLGLFYQKELVSVMSFSKSRFNKNFEYEITRFSSKINNVVIGGASKLISYFRKKFNPPSIISYADLRFGTGEVYKNLGFQFKRTTPPNYWYFNRKTNILENRLKFQKHKLKNIIENFNPNESEISNMNKNGYFQIFDCGSNVYEWRLRKNEN